MPCGNSIGIIEESILVLRKLEGGLKSKHQDVCNLLWGICMCICK